MGYEYWNGKGYAYIQTYTYLLSHQMGLLPGWANVPVRHLS